MRNPIKPSKRAFSLGLAAVLAVSGIVAVAQSSEAAVGKVVTSPTSGTAGVAGKVITLTGSGFKSGSTIKVAAPGSGGVQFQTTTCTATPGVDDGATIVNAATRQVPTATKIVITTSADLGTAGETTNRKWNVCVYAAAAGNALLATGTYATLGAPDITDAVSPASGTAAGGDIITITGTNFGKAPKVYFGTTLSPKATVAKDGLSVDAVSPAHDAGAVTISVKTDGGINPTPGTVTDDDFSYLNAVTVSDDTGDGAGTSDISVTGVGFTDLDFTRTGGAAAYGPSAVYLTRGLYNPAVTVPSGAIKTNPHVAICGSPVVVSDTELTCTVPATGGGFTNGAYTVAVVKDTRYLDTTLVTADTSAVVNALTDYPTNNISVVSSGATYSVAPF